MGAPRPGRLVVGLVVGLVVWVVGLVVGLVVWVVGLVVGLVGR
jgi:type IV secretory pathway TrbD component